MINSTDNDVTDMHDDVTDAVTDVMSDIVSDVTTEMGRIVSLANQNFVLSILYYLIGSLGLVGNLLVVVVIFQYTQMRRVLTNIYVINQVYTIEINLIY